METKPPSYEISITQPTYSPPQDHATQQAQYPTSQVIYPPQQAGYPPQQAGYPPQQAGYPPQQAGYPPQQAGYPPQQAGYPPQQIGQPEQSQPYVYPPTGTSSGVDAEYGSTKDDNGLYGVVNFDSKSVRLGFIRKVFGILILQMAVTIIMMCWFIFHEPTKNYVQKNWGMYIAGYVIFLVLYFVLVCCTNVARKHPTNLILLAIFTISLSYMVAVISSFHDTRIVLALFGMTLLISAGIIGFASQTKYDFTKWGGVLFVACFTLFIFGLFAAILVPSGWMKGLNVLYSGLGALLFMAFLAFDTQLIIGGKKYEISPEDYVFAAMMLYVDIIYIFLFLLSLFGGSN